MADALDLHVGRLIRRMRVIEGSQPGRMWRTFQGTAIYMRPHAGEIGLRLIGSAPRTAPPTLNESQGQGFGPRPAPSRLP